MDNGEEVKIDINDAKVCYKCTTNTLEISLNREKEKLYMYIDGNLVDVGSNIAPPFPIPHLLLNNIASFHPHNIYPILYSTLQDHILCDRLSVKIASLAGERVQRPLYIDLHVTITPQRIVGGSSCSNGEDQNKDTCAICFEDISGIGKLSHFCTLPNCQHMFHDDCIIPWLINHTTCPLCRTFVGDDDDEYGYYSESET